MNVRSVARTAGSVCMLCFVLTLESFGNHGPLFRESSPVGGLCVENPDSIHLHKEEITLEFEDGLQATGLYSAAYEMQTDSTQNVIMALPFLTANEWKRTVSVSMDGQPLPFEVMLGGTIPDGMKRTSPMHLVAQRPAPAEILQRSGTLYTIQVQGSGGVQLPVGQTVCYESPVGGSIQENEDAVRIEWRTQGNAVQQIRLFMLDSSGELLLTGNANQIEKKVITAEQYFEQAWRDVAPNSAWEKVLNRDDVYALASQRLSLAEKERSHLTEDALFQGVFQRRIYFLMFYAPMQEGKAHRLSVRVPIRAGYQTDDKQREYCLNVFCEPAEPWRSFGGLSFNLRVQPDIDIKHSNMPFVQTAPGEYHMNADRAPQGGIQITLYDVQQAEPIAEQRSKLLFVAGFVLLGLPLIGVVTAGAWTAKLCKGLRD